ncbi:hypothetical protein SAMN04488573_11333 [Bacillus sp. 5mfcol3.1]|nr:hypothetical protein SAMN04488573_11333 [Bacillus sp. 5mfcol3.1]
MRLFTFWGALNKNSRHTTEATTEKLKDYHFHKAFIGIAGITEDGIYYGFEEDIYFKRELIKHADQIMPNDLYNTLKENGVEIVIASEE